MEALVSNGEGTIPNAPQAGDLIKLTNQTVQAPIDALASQTVAFSHYNNLSAQLPIDPQTGRVVAGCVKTQTKQCLKNIKAILTSIDVPFDDIFITHNSTPFFSIPTKMIPLTFPSIKLPTSSFLFSCFSINGDSFPPPLLSVNNKNRNISIRHS